MLIRRIATRLHKELAFYRHLANVYWRSISPQSLLETVKNANNFVESLRIKRSPYGQYRYAQSIETPSLYASVFAVLLRHLTDDLNNASASERREWSDHIKSYQSMDGLFRDPTIANQMAEVDDWWGWRHVSLLTLMALAALDGKPRYHLEWLDSFGTATSIVCWLERLNWGDQVDFTSNAVQNRIACMQYARDFMGEARFAETIASALDYLSERCDPSSGLWGSPSPTTPQLLSRQVQAAYHFWLLYSYDSVAIPYPDLAMRQVFRTQSVLGGYCPYPALSSACEDIDSIDPIVRFGAEITPYRSGLSVRRALPWVLHNFNVDGGAVFRRDARFVLGDEALSSRENESSLFATWFRMLSLALIDKGRASEEVKWVFLDAPGYQFDPARNRIQKSAMAYNATL